eukprot:240529_1
MGCCRSHNTHSSQDHETEYYVAPVTSTSRPSQSAHNGTHTPISSPINRYKKAEQMVAYANKLRLRTQSEINMACVTNSTHPNMSEPSQPTQQPSCPTLCDILQLNLSLRNIPKLKLDSLSPSDPSSFIVVSIKNQLSNTYTTVGKTSIISDTSKPDFFDDIRIEYYFERMQSLRLDIYDGDERQVGTTHDYIGYAEIVVGDLVTANGQRLIVPIHDKQGKKLQPIAIVEAHVMDDTVDQGGNDQIAFVFSTQEMPQMKFGKTDLFFEIYSKTNDRQWGSVYTSEHIHSAYSLDCTWNKFKIDLETLCYGDRNRPVLIKCWQWSRVAQPYHLCAVTTTLAQLEGGNDMPWRKWDQRQNRYTHGNCGVLRIKHVTTSKKYQFISFLRGGLQLQLTVAIDLTGINQYESQYMKIMKCMGNVLLPYGARGTIGAYGFGANLYPMRQNASSCFSLTPEANAEVYGIDELCKDCLNKVQLSGPQYLNAIINHVATQSSAMCTQNDQSYTILLIITAGVIDDMHKTIDSIVEAAHLPLSIIFVGIGDVNFDTWPLQHSRTGKRVRRDLVQFVALNQCKNQLISAVARDTLEQIPQQIVSFMSMRNIQPNPPRISHIYVEECEKGERRNNESFDDSEIYSEHSDQVRGRLCLDMPFPSDPNKTNLQHHEDSSVLNNPNDDQQPSVRQMEHAMPSRRFSNLYLARGCVIDSDFVDIPVNVNTESMDTIDKEKVKIQIDYKSNRIVLGDLVFSNQSEIKIKRTNNTLCIEEDGKIYEIECASEMHAQFLATKLISLSECQPPEVSKDKDVMSLIPAMVSCTSIDCCESITRTIHSLEQYQSMFDFGGYTTEYSDTKRTQESDFMELFSSRDSLSDFIHIIRLHNNDLSEISRIFESSKIKPCNIGVNKCSRSKRHLRDRNTTNESNRAVDFLFYRDLMDEIHCYLFHLCDYGFRRNHKQIMQPQISQYPDSYGSDDPDDTIHERNNNRCLIAMNSDKYNIEIIQKTFMEGVHEHLNQYDDMNNVLSFLANEEYDTDSIEMDIDCDNKTGGRIQSNIAMRNITHYHLFLQFISDCKLSEHSFSIGYIFYYWNYYKNNTFDQNEQHFANRNDHRGYKPLELYIASKYLSLKEEVLNNKIYTLSIDEFEKSIYKVSQFMDRAMVKSMKASRFTQKRLHCDIEANAPLTEEHLLSIILRCDWTELCTKFSSTFQNLAPWETLSDVKRRNAECSIWSRLVIETVELFGHCRMGDYDEKSHSYINTVSGPFYCGMSSKMVFPELNIRLCTPTSTSKQPEVAARFATEDGVVMTLNNDGHYNARNVRVFDCSWLSTYHGEDEYLFVGGQYQLRIETIKMVGMGSYRSYCKALFNFECMIKGASIDGSVEVTPDDHVILDNLIKHKLRLKQNDYPNYINKLFEAITNHHTQIIINLYQINTHLEAIKDLIIHLDSNINAWIFRLFRNVTEIVIYTTKHDGTNAYRIDLAELVSSIDALNNDTLTVTIKATRYEWNQSQPSWLYHAYKNMKDMPAFASYHTEIEQTKDDEGLLEDCLYVRKYTG